MNVLELLSDELKEKNWTNDEKMRYLYLRSCMIFSYDPRYYLCENIENGKQMQKEIRDTKIDLENVETPWSVCTSYANYIYSRLLKELIDMNCDINESENHADITVEDSKSRSIDVDPSGGDYTRAKLGQNTYGYGERYGNTREFIHDLRRQDQVIGYLKDDYRDKEIEKRRDRLYQDFLASSKGIDEDEYGDDFLIYRMKEIKKEVDKHKIIEEVSDWKRMISSIHQQFLGYDYGVKTSQISLYHILPDNTWEFANIYPVSLENDMIYYALAKEGNRYSYHEITKNDAICYTKNYDGRNKGLIYHR